MGNCHQKPGFMFLEFGFMVHVARPKNHRSKIENYARPAGLKQSLLLQIVTKIYSPEKRLPQKVIFSHHKARNAFIARRVKNITKNQDSMDLKKEKHEAHEKNFSELMFHR